MDVGNAQASVLEMKIVTTRVASTRSTQHSETDYVTFSNGALIFPCAGGRALEVRLLLLKTSTRGPFFC